MKAAKYVIVDWAGFETAIIGPQAIPHSSLIPPGVNALNAGFVRFEVNVTSGKLDIEPHGNSSSTGLASNPPRDRKLIARALGLDPEELHQP